MNEVNIQNDSEIEIDLIKLLKAVWTKIWIVAGASVIGAALALLITFFFITPQYKSSVMFYVNNTMSQGDTALRITSSDISASRGLVDSYLIILQARETLADVIDYGEVERNYEELSQMIKAEAVDNTEIFQVVVTSPDPEEAERIASAIADILPKRIANIIEGTSAKIVDSAIVDARPSSPSYVKNVAIGFLLGLLGSVGAVVLWVILDTTIRTEDDITQNCKYPVLAAVPDMEQPAKGGYAYSYSRDQKKRMGQLDIKPQTIGGNISFAAAESYKLLRTKLQFAFADVETSHVIGISSAVNGEGKSVSAVNLAYSLSQLGKKVVLIDCDMRCPTLAEKLHIRNKVGLSDFLTGQIGADKLIQPYRFEKEENAFFVISAGENPPNPIELLSSARMKKMLNSLRRSFDYLILDLPPVGVVSDALAVAGETDGILLLVRQDYCNWVALKKAIQQFAFVDAKILGIVYNGVREGAVRYGSKKMYDDRSGRKGTGKRNGNFVKKGKALRGNLESSAGREM